MLLRTFKQSASIMSLTHFAGSAALVLMLAALGCTANKAENESHRTEETEQPIQGRIQLDGGWLRPGLQHGNSAAYLSISNSTATADTVQSVTAQASQEAAIHESFKGENGISGMRPVTHLVIEAGNVLYLQPGGLHIMLTDLNHDLTEGDSVNITITFKQSGSKSIRLPVKMQP